MAEEKKVRGVVVEFDFAVLDGSALLFDVAKKVLAGVGIDFTKKLEALHLAGGNYQGALAELFEKTGCKADAAQVARELGDAFKAAVAEKAPAAATGAFKEFVKAVVAKDVKVVVATRGDADALAAALEGTGATVCADVSATYGCAKWDAWRRVCHANGFVDVLTAGVTGSGHGVKAALLAGLSALAVVHEHVAYQDFGGADAVVDQLDAKAAKEILRMLKIA